MAIKNSIIITCFLVAVFIVFSFNTYGDEFFDSLIEEFDEGLNNSRGLPSKRIRRSVNSKIEANTSMGNSEELVGGGENPLVKTRYLFSNRKKAHNCVGIIDPDPKYTKKTGRVFYQLKNRCGYPINLKWTYKSLNTYKKLGGNTSAHVRCNTLGVTDTLTCEQYGIQTNNIHIKANKTSRIYPNFSDGLKNKKNRNNVRIAACKSKHNYSVSHKKFEIKPKKDFYPIYSHKSLNNYTCVLF